MLKKIKSIYSAITTVIVAIVLILVVLLVGVRLFGLKPFAVLSGSMEPKFHVGSIIYVKDVEPQELSVGDPVTFSLDGVIITHEIIEIIDNDNPYEMSVITQGLTNNVSDGIIPFYRIIGKPVFTIPYLGYVSSYLQNPIGLVFIVCAIVVILLISFILEFLTEDKKDAEASHQSSVLPDPSADPDESPEDHIKNQNINEEEKQ